MLGAVRVGAGISFTWLGFAVVFVSVGALFGDFGAHLKAHQRLLEIIFGVVTIGLGFFFDFQAYSAAFRKLDGISY